MSFSKRTDGAGLDVEKKEICANCVFFSEMAASPRDRWKGICKRLPVHVGVTENHGCGEFTMPRDLQFEYARGIGHHLVELSPHDAATVKQAISGHIAFLKHVDGIALGRDGRLTDEHASRIERLERISKRIPN